MPNRYEREIEEILRNLEQTDPKAGPGQRGGVRPRRKPGPRIRTPHRSGISISLKAGEWLLVVAVVVALIAGGYAYAQQKQDIVTGLLAMVGIVCLILVALSQFILRGRSTQAGRYGNVTRIRRSPLDSIKTQWNLLLLKMRYRRRKEQ